MTSMEKNEAGTNIFVLSPPFPSQLFVRSSFPDDSCIDCPSYVALSARDKSARLWSRIVADEYQNPAFPNAWVNIVTANYHLFRTALNATISESFDRFSDEYMAAHAKVIHTHGSAAQVHCDHSAPIAFSDE